MSKILKGKELATKEQMAEEFMKDSMSLSENKGKQRSAVSGNPGVKVLC